MEFSNLCILLFIIIIKIVSGQNHDQYTCKEERCGGKGPAIRFPFRLNTSLQSTSCGYPGFDLFCIGTETALVLPNSQGKVFVVKIDYKTQEIILDSNFFFFKPELWNLLLSKLFTNISVSQDFPFELRYTNIGKKSSYSLLDCGTSWNGKLVLAPSNDVIEVSDVTYRRGSFYCTKMYEIYSFPVEIYEATKLNFNQNLRLRWSKPDCRACEEKHHQCVLKNVVGVGDTESIQCLPPRKGNSNIFMAIIRSTTFIIIASIVSSLVIMATALYIYICHENEKEKQRRVEKFLEDYIALKPSRYTYSDIKKITDNLKYKLGQGAFGTVFKGKLSNDVNVAVKILNSLKGNGEEFINEVSTMGLIHHVNVVRLVGYCAEGLIRALVYEFFPNDSLEKYILSLEDGNDRQLCWDTMHGIALGIAKGIEYLHQGCDQRILHFDIKPHNVLLDKNYIPKIADFGLAKLCSKDQSLVSMSTARGTMGYIAPEVFSRNFGNVSYKSDVYSFGMLLLEMVGGRKNSNIDKTSHEIYYPEWIYNLLEQGKDLRIDIEAKEDCEIAKKIMIVGLWCIQWHPIARPSMKVVVQMLESRGEELIMPPNPFASTNSSQTNKNLPTRLVALELEVISE